MPVGNPLYTDYQTAADDNAAPAPIGAPEGNYQGRWVNDTFRHMMAVIRRLGDASLLTSGANAAAANISMGGNKITSLGDPTFRLDAAHLGIVQDGTAHWGGTTTGSGIAYTAVMTPAFTGSFYRTGQQVRCLLHTANTSVAPTLSVGTPGPKTIVHRNGAALRAGDLKAARYTFEFDGTNWRVLDAGGFMEQATYDQLYPVGTTRLMHNNDTSLLVPAGVSATWTLYNPAGINRLLMLTAGGANSDGGDTLSSSEGAHSHGFSGTTAGNSASSIVESGSPTGVAANPHTHTFSGTTDSGGAHQHVVNPPFHTFRAFLRTA